MKSILFILVCLVFCTSLFSQTKSIKGTIHADSNEPLIGANVYIKGTYTGATTDTLGFFHVNGIKEDSVVLVASYIGFETTEKEIVLSENYNVNIILNEKTDRLNEVIITAGTFEAGDKNRAVLLNSIDIVTTANAEGDVYGALNMLPGAQKEGETGKIIVRGGETAEAKTFIDGMLVSSPYTSSMPDIPARGRFSPFLFNGIMFSTGGYSAEYGQALSSVLSLNSKALADETVTGISILNVGLGASHTQRWIKSSLSIEGGYYNLRPYFKMAQHNLNWIKLPESYSGQMVFRQKTNNGGMIKSMLTYSKSNSMLKYNSGEYETVELDDENIFYKTSFNKKINEKLILKSGVAFNNNLESYNLSSTLLTEKLMSLHAKSGFTNFINKNLTLRYGAELILIKNSKKISIPDDNISYKPDFLDNIYGAYIESDIKLSKKIALRTGIRSEYASYTNRFNIAPRISSSFKINENNQLAMAFGKFYQQPHKDYLGYSDSLKFENTNHYIFNYQFVKDNQLLRIETYYKNYADLIKYQINEEFYNTYINIKNDGEGYAGGIDIFWRDKKTFEKGDYWISYSIIDTKRDYRTYRGSYTPSFVSKHNLSFVFKYWLTKLHTQASISYKYRSGRPYEDPNTSGFLNERTKSFNDLSLSFSHLTNISGQFTIVYVSATNILGFDNIYGYQFSDQPNTDGTFDSFAIKPFAKRTFIIGIFISIK